ncbi:MAG: HypC/HybG/HupF family hydrogenase formation chaperone [Ignavibacteria bacterium]|nr:HypC/HybG/HupF family hydrogenase formation chaperone [Ignavibacteria bacterium]
MNFITGQIEEIYVEEGTATARVNVRGVKVRVPLTFLLEARVGDTILIESGVAISKVESEHEKELHKEA